MKDAEIDVLGTTPILFKLPICQAYELCFLSLSLTYLRTFFTLSTEQDIEAFVTFFRSNFPDATFPKDAHARGTCRPILEKMALSSRFFGEQGGESIHKDFVQLASTFSHVKPSTMRLKKMLEEHHLVVHPKNRELIPEKKKRNLKRHQLQE